MSLKRKLRELKEEQEKEYKQRALCVQPISRTRAISNKLIFLIKGDALVTFGDFKRTRLSSINIYKRVLYCSFNKQSRLLGLELVNTVPGLSRFDHVVKMLKDEPDQTVHDFGLVLEKHQAFVTRQEKLRDIMHASPDFPLVRANIMEESLIFEEKVKDKIRQMEENGEIRFYSYKIIKVNLENFMYEIRKQYYSELYIALLGATPEQIQDLIVRKGLFDTSDTTELYYHLKQFLQFQQERMAKFTLSGGIRTFDGIQIDVKIHYTMIMSGDLLGSVSTLLENSEFVMVYDFELTPAMLQKVKEIRAQSSFSFDLYENEDDWEYAQEVDRFMESFYKGDMILRKKIKSLSEGSSIINDSLATNNSITIQL